MSLSHSPRIVSDNLLFHIDPADPVSNANLSYNIHPSPRDIYGWFVAGGNGTNNAKVSRETTFTSPAGGIPLKMESTGNDTHIGSYNSPPYNLSSTYVGETWTVSVWAKANKATTGQIFIFGSANGGSTFVSAPALTINITTDWQRFGYTYTMANSTTTIMQTRLDGPDVADDSTIWWDGIMVEQASSTSTFTTTKSLTIIDKSGNNNHATSTGTAFINQNSGVFAFDGHHQTITTPLSLLSTPELSRLSSWTLSCWMRFDNHPSTPTTNNYGVILGTAYYGGMAIYWENTDGLTNKVFGYVRGADNSWETVRYSTTLRTYNYFVVVNNITANQLEFYVDGALFATTTYATTPTEYNSNGLNSGYVSINKNQINGNGSFNYRYFNGRVGVTSIYKRALTAAEVKQNFNAHRIRYGI